MTPELSERDAAARRFLVARAAFNQGYKIFLKAAERVAFASVSIGDKSASWNETTAEYDRVKVVLDQLGDEMKAAGDELERITERDFPVNDNQNQEPS